MIFRFKVKSKQIIKYVYHNTGVFIYILTCPHVTCECEPHPHSCVASTPLVLAARGTAFGILCIKNNKFYDLLSVLFVFKNNKIYEIYYFQIR